MALSITTILGQDNPSQSRTVINTNFNVVKAALDTLEGVVNWTTSVATFKGVTVALPTIGTPITTNIFACDATGSFAGNLTVGETLTSKKGVFTTGGLDVDGSNFEVKQAANKIISQGSIDIHKKVNFLYSTLLDATAYAGLTGGQYTPDTYITTLDCTGNLTLLAGEEGQHIKLYMNTNGPVNIQTTNLSPLIASAIVMNGKGQVLELWYRSSKWHVIGKHGSFTITYVA